MRTSEKQGSFVVDKDGKVTVSGKVAVIHLLASWPEQDRRYDGRVAESFAEIREELDIFIHDIVRDQLGEEFRVEVEITKGSIEVVFVISTAINLMILYKDIIESINLIIKQVKHFLRALLERRIGPYVVVSGGLLPNSPISNAQIRRNKEISSSDILLYYLIGSHATLLLLFFWIIIKQLALL
jgi:hypothetical protein